MDAVLTFLDTLGSLFSTDCIHERVFGNGQVKQANAVQKE